MNKYTENRLIQAMNKPHVRQKARRLTLRTVLACTLALLFLCAIALAAANWGSREFLTYRDGEGAHVNEELASHIQPVGRTFTGDSLTVDVIDAIYDGESVILAWTLQNALTDKTVYLLRETLTVDGQVLGQGRMQNVDEMFLSPGEICSSGESGVVEREDGAPATDACQVEMKYSVLVPKGEVVKIEGLDGEADEQAQKAYFDNIDRLNAEGKVVVAPNGVIELPRDYAYDVEETRTQRLVSAGVMDLIDEVSISFTLQKNAQMQAAFKEGEARSFEFADYTLQVLKAEQSPNHVTIEMQVVFPNKEAVEKYRPYFFSFKNPSTGTWDYEYLDETGASGWFHNGGGTVEEPVEREDGTWVWPIRYSMTDLQWTPKSIIIVPSRSADLSKSEPARCMDEAVTITFS